MGKTTYMIEYEAPPLDMYAGRSSKMTNIPTKKSHDSNDLGLGENARTMYGESFLDFGEAYKQKTKPIESAKTVHIAAKGQSNTSYSTSYIDSYPVRPLEANIATKKTQETIEADGKLGHVRTVYKEDFGNPKHHEAFDGLSASKRLPIFVQKDRKKVQVQPYGPLCVSSMQQSFQPPPKSAFLRQNSNLRPSLSKTKQEPTSRSRGTRASTGKSKVDSNSEEGARRPTTGAIGDRVRTRAVSRLTLADEMWGTRSGKALSALEASSIRKLHTSTHSALLPKTFTQAEGRLKVIRR